jgi:hypothetical protein
VSADTLAAAYDLLLVFTPITLPIVATASAIASAKPLPYSLFSCGRYVGSASRTARRFASSNTPDYKGPDGEAIGWDRSDPGPIPFSKTEAAKR